MAWVAAASSKLLPIGGVTFKTIRKFVYFVTALLFVLGVIEQGHGRGGGSGIVLPSSKPGQPQPAHFASSQEDEGIKVPSTSSNIDKKDKRSAPVLAPKPSIVEQIRPTSVGVIPKNPATVTLTHRPPASTSNLRSASALQTANRMEVTPRTPPSLAVAFGLRATVSAGPSSVTATAEASNLPSSSTLPPSSIQPSTLVPTSRLACEESNPEECGCASVNQVDYIGSINITKSGAKCKAWDTGDLEEINFCRNPTDDEGGAWCLIEDGGFEHCDVPTCEDSLTATSLSPSYSPSTSHEPSIVPTNVPSSTPTNSQKPTLSPTSYCDSGSGIGDACDDGDAEKCNEFIKYCCGDDEVCKCENTKKACTSATANLSGGGQCLEAETVCCGDDQGCLCDFWEPLCTDYPKAKIDNGLYSTCYWASSKCCSQDNHNCKCDFLKHALELNGDDGLNDDAKEKKEQVCADAEIEPDIDITLDVELESVQAIYNGTQGHLWLVNTGWMTTNTSHCKWYGIMCDDNGFVIQINLKSNNVIGEIPSDSLSKLQKLKTLDLANNTLWGNMAGTFDDGHDGISNDTSVFFNLRELARVDVSQNMLSGEVDVLFAPALEHVNFSHNNFTSINSFKSFKKSHKTLKICDLSSNFFKQNASDVMRNVPPILEQLVLSNNLIQGHLPTPLERLDYLRRFHFDSNKLSGELSDFATPFPNLQELNLSNQKRDDNAGFIGTIPESLSNLPFLTTLNLASNQLENTIPSVLGNLAQLKLLDLSNNLLAGVIPRELGKLGGNLEIINLSANKLTGLILPELISLGEASIQLNGNSAIEIPAPLTFCSSPKFDLWQNESLCPPDRNALKDLYDSTKGGEWTDSNNWLGEYKYCNWLGVTCNEDEATITMLELPSNGLSGKLTESVADLSSLKVLDLSDNDIKGEIPTEIGLLSSLERLRLNHNSLIGSNTTFGNLKQIKLIQVHGNRLSGKLQKLNLEFPNSSSYIADCGNPSDFEESLICDECTMCCNAAGDCYPHGESFVETVGFSNYMQFTGFFFACIIGTSCVVALLLVTFDKYKNRHVSIFLVDQASLTAADKKYALVAMGNRSVYQFLISTSLVGWVIVLSTLGMQTWMLFNFVEGSEIELSDDNVDLSYSWKCPRDQDECTDKSDLSWQGWTAFAILMFAHLMKDIINGVKVIVLSAKERHDLYSRARYVIAGTLLLTITAFTLYVSTIYSAAIATSNTEIIMNSVVILFITDVDEFFHDILMVVNPCWVRRILFGEEDDNNDANEQERTNDSHDIKEDDEVALLLEKMAEMNKANMLSQQLSQTNIEKLEEQNKLLRDLLERGNNLPQEKDADDEADSELYVD